MTMHDPRKLIFRALFLDAVGQLNSVFIVWISSTLGWKIGGTSLESQSFWLYFLFCFTLLSVGCLEATRFYLGAV